MKLKPIQDKIVLKIEEIENKSSDGGLLLPNSVREKPNYAEVVAVGNGGKVDGEEVEILVSVGDKVIFNKYSGYEILIEKQKYIVVKQSDILAIIEGV